jgi:predicted lipoprotein with Yx(FWY)xxD motif
MKRKTTVFIAIAGPLAAVLIAAGCGNSPSGSAYSVGPYGSAGAASASVRSATGATRVGVASSRLGRIVVDGKGRTLYAFAKDKNGRSACSGSCATYWPPLLTSGKVRAGHGVKASRLGTTKRGDGKLQVTYNRHPLYTFKLDKKAGQTNGEGLNDFGGVWDVLSPAGKKVESGG